MSAVVIVQARMGSSRLPGKVLADLGGAPMLERIINRIGRARRVGEIVVATTVSSEDDALVPVAEAAGARVHRGAVLDVLDRFVGALEGLDDRTPVVRITADCPFVDPDVVDECVATLVDSGLDFVASRLPPPATRTYPVGLDVEATWAQTLRRVASEASQAFEREHVMPYIYGHPKLFEVRVLDLPEDLSAMRWTVDTADDLRAVRAIDALAGPEPYGWRRVLDVVREHPQVSEINRGHDQKQVDAIDSRWADKPVDP